MNSSIIETTINFFKDGIPNFLTIRISECDKILRDKVRFSNFKYKSFSDFLLFCRSPLVPLVAFILFFLVLFQISISLYSFFFNVCRMFFSKFFFEKKVLKLLRNKKVIVFKGGVGSKKEVFLYYLHKKLGKSSKWGSRFLLSSLKEGKIANPTNREEQSHSELANSYERGDFKDMLYEVDQKRGNQTKEGGDFANQLSKKVYLSKPSSIFFSSFSEGDMSEQMESLSDFKVICKNPLDFLFGSYISLEIEIKDQPSSVWNFFFGLMSGNRIFIRKSFFKNFDSEIVKSKFFKKYF